MSVSLGLEVKHQRFGANEIHLAVGGQHVSVRQIDDDSIAMVRWMPGWPRASRGEFGYRDTVSSVHLTVTGDSMLYVVTMNPALTGAEGASVMLHNDNLPRIVF